MPSDSDKKPSSSFEGDFSPGQVLIGRYRIVALVGEGGMGQVYLADDLVIGQSVAVKFLPEQIAERQNGLERFRAEVRHALEVTHPNVARVHDIGEVDGRHFLTMEFVDGEDLASLVRRVGRIPHEKASQIAQEICSGLAEAHRKGVLHRDLKPANVMLDGEGHVRITDFGLAVSVSEGAEAALAGTPAYMAPEQLSGMPATVQSEVYSLGLVLYELYTGQRALRGKRVDEVRLEHEQGGPEPPSSVLAELDSNVDAVLQRCLARDPADRPRAVSEVARALPGGDPLAAALAAGQLPSAALVARAGGGGGLQARTVLLAVTAIVVLLFALASYNRRTRVFPSTSPARLGFLAEEVLAELGFDELPRNHASGIQFNYNVIVKQARGELEEPLDEDGGCPPLYRYWRRWSPGSLAPSNFHKPGGEAIDDPPQAIPGSATVALDTTGRLLLFMAIPRHATLAGETDADLEPLLLRAGLDPATVVEQAVSGFLPTHCDQASTFLGEIDGQVVEIRTGSFGGRPVHFEIVMDDIFLPAGGTGEWDVFSAVWFSMTLGALVFCLRNLRRGRGDVRRANCFAALMFVLYVGIELLSIRLPEQSLVTHLNGLLWTRSGGHALLHAVHVWIMYVAIEPYVRGVWPRMLTAWVRLLDGGLRDPSVGREVLMGCLCGVAAGTLPPLVRGLLSQIGLVSPIIDVSGIVSLRSAAAFQAEGLEMITSSMLFSMLFSMLLVVTHRLTRRTWVAALSVGALFGMMRVGGLIALGAPASAATLITGIALVLVLRWGLLAGLVAVALANLTSATVFSTDLGAWHAPYSLAVFAMVLAPTIYSAVIALDSHRRAGPRDSVARSPA